MTTVLAVANQKGGVGKTTSVVNMAAYAALGGRRVLVIDCDPQANASSVLAPEFQGPCVFSGGQPQESRQADLAIIPAGEDLLDQEQLLNQRLDGRDVLSGLLTSWSAEFELILIDCPPNLTILPANALRAADRVLVPIQCEYYAMEGLGQILAFLQEQAATALNQTELAGILLTMYDSALPFASQVANEVENHFEGKVLKTRIPRDISLAAAPSHGRSILEHDPLSEGGLAYLAATKELIDGLV